ncbi:hypothetical protein YC2023_045197 [Brassica napus]
MKCQIELILLRGLGNESLIEETGFVSKVNEFEIDSSEKLERHGVTRLKGEVNELPATETIHSDTAFTATAIGFSSTMAFPVVLGVTQTRTPVTAYAGYRLRLYSSFVRDHS